MTAGTLRTIAVDPGDAPERATAAIREAASAGGLGWLPAARLAVAAALLIGDRRGPAVVELAAVTGGDAGRVEVTIHGGTGSCAALPPGLLDSCVERTGPHGERECVLAVTVDAPLPAGSADRAQAALRDAIDGGLESRKLLGAALVAVDQQARQLAASDAENTELRAELDETNRGQLAVYAELQTAYQRIADLVAMLSHDIRQPLTVITSFCTLLHDSWGDLDPAELRELFDRIAAAGIGMNQLVEEILTLTQLDSDGLGTRRATVDAHVAAAEAIGSVAEAGPDTVTVVGAAPCWVLADPRHLHQMLTNLLSNALKYGTPPVEIAISAGPDAVHIDVHDHGDGVPAEFLSHMFQRFSRADSPASRAKKGTGLGLYIVRQLAEANGGRITYRDHPTGGACFTVHVPAAPRPS